MRVSIVCFGALRDYLPSEVSSNEVSVDLVDGATVGDAIARLGAPRGLIMSALVGDERAETSDELFEGARVTLMPPFSGGRGED